MSESIAPELQQFVSADEICEALRIAKPTLYSWIAAGKFPRPSKPTLRCARWPFEQAQEWIRNHVVPA